MDELVKRLETAEREIATLQDVVRVLALEAGLCKVVGFQPCEAEPPIREQQEGYTRCCLCNGHKECNGIPSEHRWAKPLFGFV